MQRLLRGRLLAAAMVLTSVPLCAAVPAYAQVSMEISFDSFHHQLARYGSWLYSDRWGTVWQPGDVPDDFRPYDTDGHWEYTGEYGWTWISDYPWGDIAFHYGRWVYDPDDGWLWMPGYVWSPAWVVWRSNNDYVGWMPMPPDDNFLSGRGDVGFSVSWSDPDRYYSNWYGPNYGGSGSLWVFVNFGHIADRDYHRYAVHRDQVPRLVRQTTNITHYTVVNNYVVNRSVDVQRVSRAAGHAIRPVAARAVIRNPNMIATVTRGDQMRARMIHEAPRGTGKPNSAPPPSQAMINRLSDHAVSRGVQHGGQAKHLFTKSALTQPGAATHFRGGGNAMQKMRNGPVPVGQEGPRAGNGQNHQMNGGPDNTTSGPGGEQTDKAHRTPAAKFERTPASGAKPGSGPAGGVMTGPSGPDNGGPHTHRNQAPQNKRGPGVQPDNAPANGPDHRGAQKLMTPDNGPVNGPRHRIVPPTGEPNNGAPNGPGHRGSENMTGPGPALGTRREIGPPAMEGPGPGPKAQSHESGAPAIGKAGPEKERGPWRKKEKDQNPPR